MTTKYELKVIGELRYVFDTYEEALDTSLDFILDGFDKDQVTITEFEVASEGK